MALIIVGMIIVFVSVNGGGISEGPFTNYMNKQGKGVNQVSTLILKLM